MYETIPGLGFVAESGSLNNAQLTSAIRYNGQTGFTLSGGKYAITSPEFAKALFGLQAQMYTTCDTPAPGGPTANLGGSCSNIDGKYGPSTQQAIDSLPAPTGMASDAVIAQLIATAEGVPGQELGAQDIANAAAALGLRQGGGLQPLPDPEPVPVPRGNGAKSDDGPNVFLILGAAAVGLGILYYVTKRKR
ncbi:MAG: hypothetical protein CMM76_17470 [Rhodospirillaceae bacterium]|nr:hypothetical protein [Rhodospirillaceae bacterium]